MLLFLSLVLIITLIVIIIIIITINIIIIIVTARNYLIRASPLPIVMLDRNLGLII